MRPTRPLRTGVRGMVRVTTRVKKIKGKIKTVCVWERLSLWGPFEAVDADSEY